MTEPARRDSVVDFPGAPDGALPGPFLRQCALCGALDADHAWPEPDLIAAEWECPRCAAVRYLWSAVPPQQRRTG